MRITTIGRLGAAGLMLTTAASAGSFTPIGETGGAYAFTVCERPAPFEVASLDGKKGRARVEARNGEIKRYNARVGVINTYLVCIADEAGRDLQTYYNTVSATLDAEQSRLLDGLEVQRKALGAAP